jgi:hypothetical protein
MLCVAKVNLSDWPEGTRRDIDPTNERNQGLLRVGYIVPLQLPRRAAPQMPPEARLVPSDPPVPDTPIEPAAARRGTAAAKPRTKRPRTGE